MKNWKISLKGMILLFTITGLVSCESEFMDEDTKSNEEFQAYFDYDFSENQSCLVNEEEPISPIDYEGSITLGRKMNIPQTIENMQKAWEKLQDRNLYPEVENPVKVNRLYIRFLPTNKNQISELARYDESLDLFGFPLHYEFEPTTDENDSYRDTSLPLETPSPLYTVVDDDYAFPSSIPYEIIEELYMPDEDRSIPSDLADNLELVAENIVAGKSSNELSKTSKKWRPEGRIRVVDHAEGEPTDQMAVPVKGVQVMARRGLKWSWGITDEHGEFRVKKDFKKKVNYSVRWSNHEWYIIKGSSVTRAWYFGPKKEGEWDGLINGSIQSFYAQIHRAANHSYYGENYAITRPMHNKPGNDRMWIRAFNRAPIIREMRGYFKPTAPHAIWIFGKSKKQGVWYYGENYDEEHNELWRTVLHEFVHASHRNLAYIDGELKWGETSLVVKESWAMGAEGELIKAVYPSIQKTYLEETTCHRPYYRHIVKDLLYPEGGNDGLEESNPGYQSHHADFTLKDLENALEHTWSQWRENLKQGLPKAKADNIQDSFDYWATECNL